MFVEETIATILVSALVSGLLATCVSFHLNRKHMNDLFKRDVLRRLVGNRFLLTKPGCGGEGEPFIALNETFVVYDIRKSFPPCAICIRNLPCQVECPTIW